MLLSLLVPSAILTVLVAIGIIHTKKHKDTSQTYSRILSLISENISNAVVCFDSKGKCIYINKMARTIYRNENECSAKLEMFLAQNRDKITSNEELDIKGKTHQFTILYQRMKDRYGKTIGHFLKLDDITKDIDKLNKEIFRASNDPLTGLFNKTYFFKKCREIITQSPKIPRYLICTNIENFKLLNNLFGPDFGDMILREEANLIRDLRNRLDDFDKKECIIGRLSGDKFGILVRSQCFVPKHTIQKIRELETLTHDYKYKLQVYVGVYEIADPQEPVSSMVDKAMLSIKSIKGNFDQNIAFYTTNLMDKIMAEKQLMALFPKALKNNEFCIYLQPQVSAKNGEVLGAEALVRWNDPARGMIDPCHFIPTLESSGYIYQLDSYIWELAAQKLAQWQQRGIEKYIAINISAKDFYYLDVYRILTQLTEKYRINPKKLKLEFTESVLIHNIKMHIATITKLQEYGFSIEMDDFGSAYSSLTALKEIKVDVLKIDMKFLSKTKNPKRSTSILESIITMAKNLNMSIITEGVENQEHADFLKSIGCDVFQGYFYSKPISVSEFEKRYLEENA